MATSKAQADLGALYDEGCELARSGDHAGAVAVMTQLIALQPTWQAYGVRGRAYADLKDLSAALADFERAAELNPRSALVWEELAWARREAGSLARAEHAYGRATRLEPREPRLYYSRATLRADRGNVRGSIADLRKALELEPRYVEAWTALGYLASEQGDLKTAIDAYTEAIALSASSADLFVRRAGIYVRAGAMESAERDVHTARALNRSSASVILEVAKVYHSASKLELAIDEYTTAIGLDDDLHDAYRWRGEAHYELANHELALADCERAEQIRPGEPDVLKLRTNALDAIGRTEEALEAATNLVSLAPDYVNGLALRGKLRSESADMDGAARDFDAAIAVDPQSCVPYFERSEALGRRGLFDQALADCRRANRLSPNDPYVEAQTARTLYRLGRYAEAAEHAGTALTRTNSAAIRLELALYRAAVGDVDAACATLQAVAGNAVRSGVAATARHALDAVNRGAPDMMAVLASHCRLALP